MTLDLDRITHPLRLARGSHQPGSGKGCAMNVISYINGDTEITDYPACSAAPLSRLVQMVNDTLADPDDGLLSPEDSVLVLDLGWRTVGTNLSLSVKQAWMAELLIHPKFGVLQYVQDEAIKMLILRAASFALRLAAGQYFVNEVYEELFTALEAADKGHSFMLSPTLLHATKAAKCTVRGEATILGAHFLNAHFEGSGFDRKAQLVDVTRWAIERWRTLAGITDEPELTPAAVDCALERIYA